MDNLTGFGSICPDNSDLSGWYNYLLDNSKVIYPLHITINDINSSLLEKSNGFVKDLYLPMDSDFSTR